MVALLWQLWVLPSMRPESAGSFATLFKVLRRPGMIGGMLATILIFSGHFAFFTYLRPFLETVAQASVEGVSLILLGFGVANFIGTSIAGHLLARSLRLTLALVPLAMSVLALMMVAFGHVALLDGLLVAMWGFAFGTVPVGWSTGLPPRCRMKRKAPAACWWHLFSWRLAPVRLAEGRCSISTARAAFCRQRRAAGQRHGDCAVCGKSQTGCERGVGHFPGYGSC